MAKYVKLFEEYTKKKIDADTEETSHTWMQIRDAVQTKIPFVIIVFKTGDSYREALESDIIEDDYIKQTAVLNKDGQPIEYPSIFMILDDDVEFKNKIPGIFNRFKIKSLILGKKANDSADFYFSDGTSSTAGNEIVSSNNLEDMNHENHFKIGTHYYKFIEFGV
jgi:hypothetical protein